MMRKVLIMTDSCSSINLEQAKRDDIEIIPLTILVNDKEYLDGIELDSNTLCKFLNDDAIPKTSQPRIGIVYQMLEKVKDLYDHIYIVAISSYLSGTCQTIESVIRDLDLKNVTLYDSLCAAGVQYEMVYKIKKMVAENKSHEAIIDELDKIRDTCQTFIYPYTLKQLVAGGRVNATVASITSLLKIKPLLSLSEDKKCIEKFDLARTDKKIYEIMIKELKKAHVEAATHRLYISTVKAEERFLELKKVLEENFGSIDIIHNELPAVLTSHAGVGCIALQSVVK